MSILSMLGTALSTLRQRARRGVVIGRGVRVDGETLLEPPCRILGGCTIRSSCIGRGSYIAGDATLDRVRIGRFCSVGPRLAIASGRHPTSTFATTHPAFFSTMGQAGFTFADRSCFAELRMTPSGFLVDIGHDVWIGHSVTILDGVTVGTGAIIGAGSVVTRDLEPYGIFVGSPARRIRDRCSPAEAAALLASRWWDRDMPWLQRHWRAFHSIPGLLEALGSAERGGA